MKYGVMSGRHQGEVGQRAEVRLEQGGGIHSLGQE